MSILSGSEAGKEATPPQTDNPAPTQQVDKDINGNAYWYESLPDDLKSNDTIKHFKTVPDLVKSFIHAQSMIGKKGVIVPGENADNDAWEGFYKAIGRPDLDKYEVKAPEGVDAEKVKAFKEQAHKLGLLPKQAQALLEQLHTDEQNSQKAMESHLYEMTQKGIAELKKEWGDGFDKNVHYALSALKEVGGEEMQKYIVDLGLDNDVQFIKMFSKMGRLLGEDKLRGQGGGTFGMTPKEAEMEYNKLHGQLLATDPMSPQYKALSMEVEKLAKIRWPK